jgi:hypothetical protein
MLIRNFNRPATRSETASDASEAERAETASGGDPTPVAGFEPAEAEIALLRARLEHLELVVETARSLMTSNQERLLRRLHDLPHEMMALTAKLARVGEVGSLHINDSNEQVRGLLGRRAT